jgi:hypothetical protein
MEENYTPNGILTRLINGKKKTKQDVHEDRTGHWA